MYLFVANPYARYLFILLKDARANCIADQQVIVSEPLDLSPRPTPLADSRRTMIVIRDEGISTVGRHFIRVEH